MPWHHTGFTGRAAPVSGMDLQKLMSADNLIRPFPPFVPSPYMHMNILSQIMENQKRMMPFPRENASPPKRLKMEKESGFEPKDGGSLLGSPAGDRGGEKAASGEEERDDDDDDVDNDEPLQLMRMLEQEVLPPGRKRQQLEAEAAAAQRMVCPDTPFFHEEDDIVKDPDWGPVTSLFKSKAGACKCATNCANRRCSCLRGGQICTLQCKCTKEKCLNRQVERDVVTNDLPRRRVLRSQTSFMQAVPHGLV
ncbi:uncharacterized protein [Littorina saxatilis]|uniref:uncharacterized protein n=1 Tax=Littorina saxatilis TaxID=31220 RepID=UPI0038B6365C